MESTFINLSENIYFIGGYFARYVPLNESSAKASCDTLKYKTARLWTLTTWSWKIKYNWGKDQPGYKLKKNCGTARLQKTSVGVTEI